MFVEVVIIESGHRRLEDMSGRGRPGRNTPTSILQEQRCLRLSTSEAELAREGLTQPGCRVLSQFAKTLGHAVLGEPGDVTRASENSANLVRWRKSDGACAVLTDLRR